MFRQTLIGAVAFATALTFSPSAGAQAQEPTTQPPMIEGIIVVAPRITYETDRRRYDKTDGSVLPYTITEATETVPVAGLDLSRTRDVFILEERVEAAAKRVCQQLEQKMPRGEPRQEVCVERAIDDAWEQVRRVSSANLDKR